MCVFEYLSYCYRDLMESLVIFSWFAMLDQSSVLYLEPRNETLSAVLHSMRLMEAAWSHVIIPFWAKGNRLGIPLVLSGNMPVHDALSLENPVAALSLHWEIWTWDVPPRPTSNQRDSHQGGVIVTVKVVAAYIDWQSRKCPQTCTQASLIQTTSDLRFPHITLAHIKLIIEAK